MLRKAVATSLLAPLMLGVIASMALLSASSASANSLISTNPTIGSTVNSSPSAVTIRTTDPVMDIGNSVEVTDPQGNRVDDGTLSVDGTNIVAGLKLLKVSGVYTVAYTFLTDNDVPLEGTFTFSFKAPEAVSSQSPSAVIVEPTPTNEPVNPSGAPTFIILLMMSAFLVFVGLCIYAWKIITKR
jgi:methionine-rich copper-binding protein CopC